MVCLSQQKEGQRPGCGPYGESGHAVRKRTGKKRRSQKRKSQKEKKAQKAYPAVCTDRFPDDPVDGIGCDGALDRKAVERDRFNIKRYEYI